MSARRLRRQLRALRLHAMARRSSARAVGADVLADGRARVRAVGVARRSARRARKNSCRRRRAEYLPPQRTFSPLSTAGHSRTQDMQHYEVGVERVLNGATIGVRVFDQHIDNQTVTVFGLRRSDAAVGARPLLRRRGRRRRRARRWCDVHARARRQHPRLGRLFDRDRQLDRRAPRRRVRAC